MKNDLGMKNIYDIVDSFCIRRQYKHKIVINNRERDTRGVLCCDRKIRFPIKFELKKIFLYCFECMIVEPDIITSVKYSLISLLLIELDKHYNIYSTIDSPSSIS